MSDKYWNRSISGNTQPSFAEILGVEMSMSIGDMRDVTAEWSGGFTIFSRIFCERSPKAVFFCVLRFLWQKKATHPAEKKTDTNLHDFKGKLPWEVGESSADLFFWQAGALPDDGLFGFFLYSGWTKHFDSKLLRSSAPRRNLPVLSVWPLRMSVMLGDHQPWATSFCLRV